jgi:hypothetical protein
MMADGEIAQDESTWIPFQVRGLDTRTLKLIRRDAYRRKLPVQDWVRNILCRHYDFDCPKTGRFSDKRSKSGHSTTFLVRLYPDLHQALKDESKASGISMNSLAKSILETPYRKKAA